MQHGLVSVLMASALLTAVGCSHDSSSPRGGELPASASSAHSRALRLLQPVAVHHATKLADGRVLITGGCTLPGCGGFDAARDAQIFNPSTRHFQPGPRMLFASASGTATLLDDGRVLLTGGYPAEGQPPTAQAELFEPKSDKFVAAGSMLTPRADHSTTRLPDGRVLVCGGFDASSTPLRTCEYFDPQLNRFKPGPTMSAPRAAHAAVVVQGHLVLVGGTTGSRALATTDVLQGSAWSPGPKLDVARVKLAAAALPGARLLAIGGATSTVGRVLLSTTEVVNLNGHVTPGPSLSEGEYKLDGAVASLPDGQLVIAGGQHVNVYNPKSNAMKRLPHPLLERRSFVTATPVGFRAVLVAGGYDDAIVPTSQAVVVAIPG